MVLPRIGYMAVVDLNATFASSPPVWRMLASVFILLTGIALALALSRYLPRYLAELIRSLDKEKGEEDSELKPLLESLDRDVRKFVLWSILLVFGFLAFQALGYNVHTEFQALGYTFAIFQILVFSLVVIVFFLFEKTVLSPITRLVLQALFAKNVSKREVAREHKKLQKSMNFLFMLIGIWVALDLAFPGLEQHLHYWPLNTVLNVAAIAIGTVFVTRLMLFLFRIMYTIPRKLDTHASNAFENIVKILALLVAIGLLLSYFGIDPVAIFGALTFIGIAVAFGLQDSIANIMAGFMLAGDKPFAVGDRVRLGEVGRETWGDVVKIGLNSTRIRTVEGELVVIPNHLIARYEIWNYTRESPVIVHKMDIGISYGSDWRLAKKLILEEANSHPRIAKRPQPHVRIDRFGEFSVVLKLWVWLKNAKDRDQVRSDLLGSIKDRFDEERVEIPFPYRTVVFKKEMAEEKKLADRSDFSDIRRYPSQGYDYMELGDWHLEEEVMKRPAYEEGIRVLTTSSNPKTAKKIARYAVKLAKKSNGNVISLYVMKEYTPKGEERGLNILKTFEKTGKEENVPVATFIETGDVVDSIAEYTKKNNVDFVVIGKSERGPFDWMGETMEEYVKERVSVPVITV